MPEQKAKEAAAKKRQDTYRQVAVWLPAVTVILVLAYAGAAWFLLFVPKISQLLPGGTLDNSAIQERIATDQAYVDRIDRSLSEFTTVAPSELDKIERILPNEIAFPSLLGQLESIAVRHNMLLTGLQVSSGAADPALSGAVPLRASVNFTGGAEGGFLSLLRTLEKSQRLFDLQSFQYSPDLSGVGMDLTTYYLP